MCPGESAGRSTGQSGPDDLASAILARIAGGDLPARAELDPARLALLFGSTELDTVDALRLLQGHGATEHDGSRWRVAASRSPSGRDILYWAAPLLRAVVSLAASRISPAEAASVLAAYDRFAGLAGDGTAASRAAGYRLMLERIAAASGSRFHVLSVRGFCDHADAFLDRMVAKHITVGRPAGAEDELARLAQALMQGNAAAAAAAVEDHLLLIARHLDSVRRSG